MRLLAVALPLEIVPEAVVEAEATARWYAARSPKASAGFIEELDADRVVIVAIAHGHRRPDYWRSRLPG